ncbi:cytochrome-c peroxidase [Engelhardtia mirabilis]|uniref:Cytochrome c551 peroxidase n=1 Tax=Engelhardtia mirabilis TaxID=2528011 RepID=A0A518BSA2_9BACT|nr:Cytochrome c551 peroxidase precursor [Planctomycetes bacterium Pla133]QDV04173.1 Cytochrome c551 peroxidase precursor [Planctomycetes bacterium Pla86]
MKALVTLALVAPLAACTPRGPALPNAEGFSPLPPAPASSDSLAGNPDLAAYGQSLFFTTGLSFDQRRSCASCHRPDRAFSGAAAIDTRGFGPRDVPPLVGVARRTSWMWSGEVDSLEQACLHGFGDEDVLGGSLPSTLRFVAQSAALAEQHRSLFGNPPKADGRDEMRRTLDELGRALAAYLRQLEGGPSRFDEAAADQSRSILAADARRGFELFHGRAACNRCHGGPNFSDGKVRDQGLPDLPEMAFGLDPDDPLAKLEAGQRETNPGLVRTPSLRDVARTAPYMHDGRFADLREVLRFYSESVGNTVEARARGVTLKAVPMSEREIADLEAFLRSLDSAPLPGQLRRPVR